MLVKILIMKIVTFLISPSALTRVFRVVPDRSDFSLSSSGFFLIKIWISPQHQVDFPHHQVDENCDLLNVTRCFGQSVWVGSCESVTFTEFDQFLNDSECIPIMKMTVMRMRMCLGVVLIVASGFEKNVFFNLQFFISMLCNSYWRPFGFSGIH